MRRIMQWPPLLCVGLSIALGLALPAQYRFLPKGLAWGVAAAGAILVALANLARRREHLVVSRRLNGAVVILLSFLTARSLYILVRLLIFSGGSVLGLTLLQLAATVWLNNVMTFALCYWLLDRGGPAARAAGERAAAEWMFPEMSAPDFARPDWRPRFPEYLFLALTTATAFSPTDTAPLSTRARALMGLEALISLITLALVAARAVNILA